MGNPRSTRSIRSGAPQVIPTDMRWPEFLVTAPHLVLSNDGRVPHGTWHARRVGSLQTECGSSAVTWHYFWTLDFGDAGHHACPYCFSAIRMVASDRAPS
jgi:hypothetical protein